MAQIIHQVTIKASAKNIYELVSTKAGIEKWLTQEGGWKISGDENVGDTLFFYFGGNHHEMKISKLAMDEEVQWECTVGPPEWIGTFVNFLIDGDNKKCTLRFEHGAWKRKGDFFALCSQIWKGYVTDIKNVAEEKQPAQLA